MKPVTNATKFIFPKVGDRLKLRKVSPSELTHHRTVVRIDPCDHRPMCKQDDHCKYCLRLTNADGHESSHCWNNFDGDPWWTIMK